MGVCWSFSKREAKPREVLELLEVVRAGKG